MNIKGNKRERAKPQANAIELPSALEFPTLCLMVELYNMALGVGSRLKTIINGAGWRATKGVKLSTLY